MHQVVYNGHTGQHPVQISDDKHLRSLRFGTEERQSCIDLRAPWQLQLAYCRWMTTALLLHPEPNRFLVFGLGGGALPHFLFHHHPHSEIDVVEKEQLIIDLAYGYFQLPEADNLRVVCQEALQFLEGDETVGYHVAFLDIFGPGEMAPALFNPALYRSILTRLSSDGVLAVNLWCGDKNIFRQALQAAEEGSAGQLLQMQVKKRANVILLLFPGPVPYKAVKKAQKRSLEHQLRYRLNFTKYLKRLRRTNRSPVLEALFG